MAAKACKLDVVFDPSGRGPQRVRGPAYRMVTLPVGAEGKHGPITKYTSSWARQAFEKIADCVTMASPRQSGHEIEGRVRIRGKSYSAFTSSDDPSGIIVRMKSR